VNRQQRRAEKRQHGKTTTEMAPRPAASPSPIQGVFDAAVAHHQAGRLDEAEVLYRQVLAVSPDHADSLNLLGVAAIQSGRSETAIAFFTRAVAANPRADSYQSNLGSALAGAGRLGEAIDCFRRALDLRPDSPEAQNNLGNALLDQGEPEAATPYLRRAIALRPDYAEAQYNLGIALAKLRRPDEAVACYRRALALRPDYPDALNNLGQTLWEQGERDEAADCFRRAMELRPNAPEALNNLGISLRDKGERREAVEHFRRAVALRPAYLDALNNLAVTLNDLGRFEEAAATYRRSLAIKPELVHERNNLGAALAQLGRFEEAGECYRRALSLQPDYPEALNNLGNVLRAQGRLDEAIAAYRQAAALKDDYPDVHHNLAMALLASGEFAAGWTEYEWRWQTDQLREAHRDVGKPLWRGEAGAGRTLLIHAEQGFGDTIQFCRYAPLAAARGWRVVMMVQRALVRLLGSLDGVAEVRAARADPPSCDAQCPMMSLPLALGTTLATIPAPRSYLHADPREASAWGQRLAELGGRGVRVGLVWAGNPGRSPIARPDGADLRCAGRAVREPAEGPARRIRTLRHDRRHGRDEGLRRHRRSRRAARPRHLGGYGRRASRFGLGPAGLAAGPLRSLLALAHRAAGQPMVPGAAALSSACPGRLGRRCGDGGAGSPSVCRDRGCVTPRPQASGAPPVPEASLALRAAPPP
jgi:tetratricopeptide (TPR) repeat protein